MFNIIVGVVATLAALLYMLDYFGVKPKQPLWGLQMPLSKNWKLAIMLGLGVCPRISLRSAEFA